MVEYTLEHKLHYTAAFTNRGRVRCDASSVKLRCVVENNEDLANEMEGLEVAEANQNESLNQYALLHTIASSQTG